MREATIERFLSRSDRIEIVRLILQIRRNYDGHLKNDVKEEEFKKAAWEPSRKGTSTIFKLSHILLGKGVGDGPFYSEKSANRQQFLIN